MADLETNLAIIQEFADRLAVTVVGAEETTAKHERFVEGEIDETIPTENGPVKTLKGKIAQWDAEIDQHLIDIGYEPAVTYSIGLVITRRSQTVLHNDIIYFWSGSFPITTNGLFTEGNWLTTPINNAKYISDTAPVGVSQGATWFDTISGKSFIYFVDGDGTGSWVEENATSVVAVTGKYIGSEPPLNPVHGNSWYSTLDGRTYIFFEDGTSSQWVEENPQSSSEEGLKITVRSNLKRLVAELGFVLVDGSFEDGTSITDKTMQVVWKESSGKIYKYVGIQSSVVVSPGFNPETSSDWDDNTGHTLLETFESGNWLRYTNYMNESDNAQAISLLSKLSGRTFDVEEFGALGNGSDDSSAFLKAWNHLKLIGGGTLTGQKKEYSFYLDISGINPPITFSFTGCTLRPIAGQNHIIYSNNTARS